jgi:hypothetical protein
MTTREALEEIVQGLPENRVNEILDFARFLSWQEEREAWRQAGRASLARAYGPEEPDYTLEDLKAELNS